ncbi:type III PLP-dependent enzyme [Streptomyces sp. YIM 98790]|uniref:type III PLP-dependent enzyme n=1 Tax=Streptomyces sp. YIM 98790 TaxID=2689077 RepID=UPI001A9E4852|nr:type III PLP-dependent enzyme [Streptomyces sp. YIM 98790]
MPESQEPDSRNPDSRNVESREPESREPESREPESREPGSGERETGLPSWAGQDIGETPAYVYDLARVRANHAALRGALPVEADLYYSLKANPHPALLAELRARGVRPEVCSPGELAAALDAGWPAGRVLYTGPGKRDRDLDLALAEGVREFSADSPAALDQLRAAAAARDTAVRCLLRVNDDQAAGSRGLAMTGGPSQFGADTEWIVREPRRFAGRDGVTVHGLHFYLGTNLESVPDLVGQFRRSVRTAARLAGILNGHGADIRVLDLGGGFGAPFARAGRPAGLSGLRAELETLLDRELPRWRTGRPRIVFESGRYLVGSAGTLVTAVLDVKRSHGRDVVVLESGINHLGGMSGLRRLPPLVPHLLTGRGADGGEPAAAESGPAMIAGPLCTPLDLWARTARLPRLRPGDLVAVPNVGAYGLYASLVAFLGHPLPVEIVLDSDRPGLPPERSRLGITRASLPNEKD